MAKITDFRCIDELGNEVPCDAFGNNVAVRCPRCGHPILAIALENQRGFSQDKPAACRSCRFECWITIERGEFLGLHPLINI
jgi:hypothetical protein